MAYATLASILLQKTDVFMIWVIGRACRVSGILGS